MRRWFLISLVGLLLGVAALWLKPPLDDSLYAALYQLKGPEVPSGDVVLLTFPEEDATYWRAQTLRLLELLKQNPPRLLEIEFEPGKEFRKELSRLSLPFQVSAHPERLRFHSERNVFQDEPHLEAFPSELFNPTQIHQSIDHAAIQLVRSLGININQEHTFERSFLVRVFGPPGTFERRSVSQVIAQSDLQESLKNKILLLSAPSVLEPVQVGSLPLFSRNIISNDEITEIYATYVENYLHQKYLRALSEYYEQGLTIAVSVFVVVVLFSTVPLLGIFFVVLVSLILLVVGISLLHQGMFLNLMGPLFAIAFIYYFLIPYRLIVEYKGRWKYQQENRYLNEVETLKENFISLVSHNLKTPIARIEGIVESILAKGDGSIRDLKDSLNKILISTEDLNRFVSRILNLARIEDPLYEIQIANHDLNAIVEEIIQSHQDLADKKEISIQLSLEPLFPAPMDEHLIRESIANLVDNAIKYSPPKSVVHIRTQEVGEWIEVLIQDAGPGIPSHELPKIFTKFYRGKEVKNQDVRGSGLGLYLVKYFIEKHGGQVEVFSEEGKGTKFIVRLRR